MIVLAFDTSNQPISVVVSQDHQVVAEVTVNHAHNHEVTLFPYIDFVLTQAHLTLAQVDKFVVAVGPGSYTGIRIAVTAAKTLAFTLKKPVFAVSSLAVLATSSDVTGTVLTLMDARRQHYFAGLYEVDTDKKLTAYATERYLAHTDLAEWIKAIAPSVDVITVAGMFTSEQQQRLQADLSQYSVQFLPQLLPRMGTILPFIQDQHQVADIHRLVPNYLRITEAEYRWHEAHPQALNHENYVEDV